MHYLCSLYNNCIFFWISEQHLLYTITYRDSLTAIDGGGGWIGFWINGAGDSFCFGLEDPVASIAFISMTSVLLVAPLVPTFRTDNLPAEVGDGFSGCVFVGLFPFEPVTIILCDNFYAYDVHWKFTPLKKFLVKPCSNWHVFHSQSQKIEIHELDTRFKEILITTHHFFLTIFGG